MHNHLATKPADAVGLIHIVILGRKDEQQLLPRQHQSEPGKMKAEIPSEFVKVGYTSWPSVMHFARSRVPQYTPKDFTRTTLKEVAAIYMAKPSQGVNAVEEQFTHNVACQHGQQGRSDQQTSQKRKCSTLESVSRSQTSKWSCRPAESSLSYHQKNSHCAPYQRQNRRQRE